MNKTPFTPFPPRAMLAGLLLLLILPLRGHLPAAAQSTHDSQQVYLPFLSSSRPPILAGCAVFPENNIWNTPVDRLPIDDLSEDYIRTIGASRRVHADFGSGTWEGFPIGIPYVVVPGSQPKVPVRFDYASESDLGPYPIPPNPPVEGDPNGSGDRHILMVDRDQCKLYELFAARRTASGWSAGSGAIFDLNAHALRPDGWTSADAAGLPILPGLARYEEVAAGEIRHALRFTAPQTRKAHIWPARHNASSLTGAAYPPMGQRFRLKASFDINRLASPEARIIAAALKKYGMILADNGSAWYISGAPDPRWNNDVLHELDIIMGSDFEAVDTSGLMIQPNSGEARQP